MPRNTATQFGRCYSLQQYIFNVRFSLLMYAAIDRFRTRGDGTIVQLHPSKVASRKRTSVTSGNSETEPGPSNYLNPDEANALFLSRTENIDGNINIELAKLDQMLGSKVRVGCSNIYFCAYYLLTYLFV